MMPMADPDLDYTERLTALQGVWWKRALDVQAPYRWNMHRLTPGRTLDVGCGIGRTLLQLRGQGVGVDHNADSVAVCRKQGLIAYTPDEFWSSDHAKVEYDSILLAHVAEHMLPDQCVDVISNYARLLKREGKLILITPQEAGYKSDPTHCTFVDFAAQKAIFERLKFRIDRSYSFPFPRAFGKVFKYNEFVGLGIRG